VIESNGCSPRCALEYASADQTSFRRTSRRQPRSAPRMQPTQHRPRD